MSHTPGPWKRYLGSGAIEIRGGTVGSLTQPRVSRVLRADPNCDANANLIAAAPDLLAALRAMLAIVSEIGISSGVCCCGDDMDRHENPFNCGHVAVDSGHYHSGPLLESARTAIAKATGETE